jgi:hypothetical protein
MLYTNLMPAPYLAVLDAGSTMLKLALFHKTPAKQQQLCISWVVPRLFFDATVTELLKTAQDWIKQQSDTGEMELAVVGHHAEVSALSHVKWRISHEDALQAVARRLSSTSTVVVIDIGSRRTLVALGKYGKVSLESFTYGVGLEAWNIVRQPRGLESVRAWISSSMADSVIENYLANKSLYAEIIPTTNEELMIEQAVAKALLQGVARELTFPWQEVDMVVVTGAVLTQTPIVAQTVAMILDGLTPLGTLQIISDPSLTLMACGGAFEAWSAKDYRIGRTIMHQSLAPLGTIVGLDTSADNRQRLAKVTLDIGLDQNQTLEVKTGDLLQLPLPVNDQGVLQVVGAHSQVVKQAADLQAVGGEAGLIIDGRGRPLVLSSNDDQRRAQLLQWDRQLNAHHQYGTIGETV